MVGGLAGGGGETTVEVDADGGIVYVLSETISFNFFGAEEEDVGASEILLDKISEMFRFLAAEMFLA